MNFKKKNIINNKAIIKKLLKIIIINKIQKLDQLHK